jgi:hypothetical protein
LIRRVGEVSGKSADLPIRQADLRDLAISSIWMTRPPDRACILFESQKGRTTMRSLLTLRLLSLAGVILGLTVPAAAQCNTGRLQLPNIEALKLSDGEHVIATLQTMHGKMEARVTVKGKVVSEPVYSIGGKLLEETPKAKVQKGNRPCLKMSSLDDDFVSWYTAAARSVLDSIITPAYAKQCRAKIVSVSCTSDQCCAMARCGNYYVIRCADY